MSASRAAGPSGQVTRHDVIRAGRRRFLRLQRVDLVSLAQELGVARATLYRWMGDRNRLTGEVLWSLTSDTLDLELSRDRPPGASGLADAFVDMLRDVVTHPAFQHFLREEPRALAILTGRGAVPSERLRARTEQLVLERCPSAVGEDLGAEELAYAIVRLAESYCYSDAFAGREVDVDRARPLFLRLLSAPAEAPRATAGQPGVPSIRRRRS